MKATIKSVAAAAGVSRGTVDRVLNNRPYVKEETKKKVLDAIKKLEYEPNWVGRALVMQNSTKKIAFILPKIETKAFKEEFYRGIDDARNEISNFGIEIIDHQCMVRMKNNKASEDEYLRLFDDILKSGIDGLIIYTLDHPNIRKKINEICDMDIPVITVTSDVHNCKRLCFIGCDEYKNGRIAGDLILKCSNLDKDILTITASHKYDASSSRIQGFMDVVENDSKFKGKIKVVECFNSYELTYDTVLSELKTNINNTTIYMATENVIGCIDAVRKSGRAGEISIVSHGPGEYYKDYVINNDLTFCISQNTYMQSYRPLIVMKDILFFDKYPVEDTIYTMPYIMCRELIR